MKLLRFNKNGILFNCCFFFQAVKVDDLGVVDFEREKEERNKAIYVPSWFTVDLKTGVSYF